MKISSIIDAAVREQLLPEGSAVPHQESRPWPVVLLTALGAWLAAVPLLGVISSLFGPMLSQSGGLYLVGGLLLALAVSVLRSRDTALFLEQLAVPALLVGGLTLGYALSSDLKLQTGAALMLVICIGLALALPRPWMRVLLGATSAQLLVTAVTPAQWSDAVISQFWFFAWHGCLALWLVAKLAQSRWLHDGSRTRTAAALESLSSGWLLSTLFGLCWWSGMTFLLGGALGMGRIGAAPGELGRIAGQAPGATVLPVVSSLLAVAAAWCAARQWPGMRRPWLAGVALASIGLAWFMSALGAVLLALVVCATTGRRRLAGAAALATAWIVGAFYYQLNWSLTDKALVLVVIGCVFGTLAWLALPARGTGSAAMYPQQRTSGRWSRWAIGCSALTVLAVVNVSIWQKEKLIAEGRPVYAELAPIDPRSLIQGDYMALRFSLPPDLDRTTEGLMSGQRPHVIAQPDARGVLTMLRVDRGAPLAANELRIELTPKDGRWILVSDAWFFKEGEAQRYAAAKYGEFRVDAEGRALLVGLRDAKLESL